MFDRHFGVWPKGLPHSLTPPATTLSENLTVAARRFPDKVAIHYYGTRISWTELDRATDRLAGWLSAVAGVGKGDRVILFMQNSPQFVIGYYAILRANAVVVPVNTMSKIEELRHIVADTDAAAAVVGQEMLDVVAPLVGETPLKHVVVGCYGDYVREATDLELPEAVAAPRRPVDGPGMVAWEAVMASDHPVPPLTVGLDDWCVLPFSSGTTGRPKGCLHTHRTVGFTMYGNLVWSPSGPESVSLVSLPLFHVTGMQNSMNMLVYQGATMVMMTRWNRRTAAALIARHQVSHWRCITTMCVDLLSDPEAGSFDLSSLVAVSGGGAQMPAAVADRLHALTGIEYLEGYGLTETIAPTHINPVGRSKRQCGGIPFFDTDARVVDPETLAELGPEAVGEIVVSGPQVFLGYWNRPDDTAAVFFERDGKRFFRTGDLGYYDDEGYFFLVDRLKRMINASGFKVWPAEVEAMMYEHPGIQEVCVIATPDPRRGETVKAVVVPRNGASPTAEDIQSWCRERMAAYKVPAVIEFSGSLPKSPTGKVQWRVLQDQENQARAATS
ncbi:long-chain-fatty-acid--CoA ligase [Thalassobaculum fulvum]|uniref:Long-chain-fatty-acid--CoA ligase n=1 Tax=Thalassobaculum fulvum TaxID=1633335 RepID=A0A918XTF4_9PROT|nr:long-chain-fatty-acid--CoA ligase [Thalassobaculum fulvum]GHD51943.1 long-chain-fatty-acid--CoA ligase [Thalassobaculum fulvum]